MMEFMADQGAAKPISRSAEAEFWIVSDRVLSLEAGIIQESPSALAVSSGSIVEVRAASALRDAALLCELEQKEVPVVDVGAAPIVPGFVNAHTHLAMAPLRGIASTLARRGNVVSDVFFALESHLRPEDVRAFTRLGAVESLLCGVTEVWDHYYFGQQVALGLMDVGLCGTVAPTLQDLAGPGKAHWEEQLEATELIDGSSRFRSRGVRAAFGPHATDTVGAELLEMARDGAERLGTWVHLHAAQSWDEARIGYQNGSPGIARRLLEGLADVPALVAHGLFFNQSDCRELAGAGVTLAYCPLSQLQFGFLGPLAAYRASGGRWVLGTDCVASNDALDVQRELSLTAGHAVLAVSFEEERRKFMQSTDRERLRCAEELERKRQRCSESTPNEVELLTAVWGAALSERAGARPRDALVKGTAANFLVLDADHPALFPSEDMPRLLCYGATSAAINFSCVGGKIIGKEHGFAQELIKTELYREWLSEGIARRDELFERARMT